MKYILILLFSFNVYGMRVISTSPALTEMVAKLDREESLVGVTPYCLDGKSAQKVGTALELDYEKVVSLKPDIVLLQENTPGKTHRDLQKLKIPVLALKIVTLNDLFDSWEKIAKLLNADVKNIKSLKNKIRLIKKTGSAIFVLGGVPGQNVMVAGKGTFYDDLMKKLGFENLVKSEGWPILDAEKIRSLNKPNAKIYELATNNERLWRAKEWKSFCPHCNVQTWSDPRATFPGPTMVESLIHLMESSK